MEEKTEGLNLLILSVVLTGFVGLLFHLYNGVLLKPKKLRLKLQNQGIKGPCPSFLYGNIHEMKRIQLQALATAKSAHKDLKPDFSHHWVYVLVFNWKPATTLHNRYGNGERNWLAQVIKLREAILSKDRGPLLGQGILSSSGPIWSHQRKIIAPEFFPDKVKEKGILEIIVDEDLRSLSADIISRACFGSNYSKGEEIFSKLKALQMAMAKTYIGIPGMRYLPSKNNREIWKLEKEIDSLILSVVKHRTEEATHGKDLLQMILDGAETYDDYKGLSKERFIVDNCKNMYFAGYETTATTLSWTLMLLAASPDWQALVRAKVLETCKDGFLLDANALRNMKTVCQCNNKLCIDHPFVCLMIVFPIGSSQWHHDPQRQDIDFKGIMIPKDMNIQIPIPALQQSLQLWGPDVHRFNPERFANGIVEACKVPQAYMPFGIGARICTGQHFAMAELKVALSLLLSKFCFSLSPAYVHSPAFRLVIQPEHGVRLLIKRV
ncbi:hypothetical protein CXB51_031808 [Gossypium anomalum]|uniref:Cytochrome P450 n=1 Tax=Gossypium anomalum TaxID=47600 RepID=A0A8J5YCX3_9ROSI|nr:hypothetical protein CXB51_031808 [Gossypium anomalum]